MISETNNSPNCDHPLLSTITVKQWLEHYATRDTDCQSSKDASVTRTKEYREFVRQFRHHDHDKQQSPGLPTERVHSGKWLHPSYNNPRRE